MAGSRVDVEITGRGVRGRGGLYVLLFVLLLLFALALRSKAVFTDFWLDEIWSLRFAEGLTSPLQIVTSLHHDNNHHLNTFFLYLMRGNLDWHLFRLPSLLAGTGTVLLSGIVAGRRGPMEGLTALLFTSTSYLLVLYSSEARGYALMTFFAFLAYYLLEGGLTRERLLPSIAFNVAVVLGFLSHLTFIHIFSALFAWSLWRVYKGQKLKPAFMIRWFALPSLFLAAFYFIDLRFMVIGGGAIYTLPSVVAQTIALFSGAPHALPFILPVGIFLAFVMAREVLRLYSEGDDRWVFYAVVLLLSPLLLLVVAKPLLLYVRYFLVTLLFFMLLFSGWLCRNYRKSVAGKGLYCLILILYLAGNASLIGGLFKEGRGHYLEALRYMEKNTVAAVITVGGDHDFRTSTVLDFYSRYLPDDRNFRYFTFNEWPEEGPEWTFVHSLDVAFRPPETIREKRFGLRYDLKKAFLFSGRSGWNWFLYRRADR